jgi:hypothetical protein
LSGSRRGLERHQTLRQAVQWSYDLLSSDEQAVLAACAVFAGGFEVVSVTAVHGGFDEYEMLDLLDSLVRKSLITASRGSGRARYGLLETIRQFTEDQHAGTGGLGGLRDRHARWFADQAIVQWDLWDGPGFDAAVGWAGVEFENLRAGFRWATDQADLAAATAIAAHTTMFAYTLQQFEPVVWVEELLPAAVAAEVTQLPRLYTAASGCMYMGRAEDAVGYAQAAVRLQDDPGYQPFTNGWATFREAQAHLFAGRVDRYLEICTGLATQTGLAHVIGLFGMATALAVVGRDGEAIAIGDDAMAAARAYGNPFWVAAAYLGSARAYAVTDPQRALDIVREGLVYARQHPMPFLEAAIARNVASLEATQGDLDHALDMFAMSIHSFHQAGSTGYLAGTLARLVVFFDGAGRPEIAATLSGATATKDPVADLVLGFAAAVGHLRETLGADTFDTCVRAGAAMTIAEAVHYAHHHIDDTRQQRT